jgi:hypothetical protein
MMASRIIEFFLDFRDFDWTPAVVLARVATAERLAGHVSLFEIRNNVTPRRNAPLALKTRCLNGRSPLTKMTLSSVGQPRVLDPNISERLTFGSP